MAGISRDKDSNDLERIPATVETSAPGNIDGPKGRSVTADSPPCPVLCGGFVDGMRPVLGLLIRVVDRGC